MEIPRQMVMCVLLDESRDGGEQKLPWVESCGGMGGWRWIGLGCRPAASGILVPRLGIEPVCPAQEHGLLTSGPPGPSLTSPAVNGLSCTSSKPLSRCCGPVSFLPSSHLWRDSQCTCPRACVQSSPVPMTENSWNTKGLFFFLSV